MSRRALIDRRCHLVHVFQPGVPVLLPLWRVIQLLLLLVHDLYASPRVLRGALNGHLLYGVETFTSLPQLVASKKTRPKVILSSHSLEHFTYKSALELLSDVKVCLDATGVFILEVPNVDLRFIENNRSDDSPHFMFFSQESLRLFFESNGFNVLFCQSCGVLQQHTRELIGNSVSEYPIKTHLKNILKKMMYFLGVKIPLNLNNPDLIYGDNRVCLRMVVSLQK